MTEAKLIIEDWEGKHNTTSRAIKISEEGLYKDCSTICIVPTRGMIAARVVQNWMGLITPMNQKFIRLFVIGMEVGEAYSMAIEQILANPELAKWKYILTLEEDNIVPPDGLIGLMKAMNEHPEYDCIGALYWTKGEGGQPMIYGDPNVMPKNFIPQVPLMDTVQPANGLGMGFNLFKLSMFKDKKLQKPFFKTLAEYIPGAGSRSYSQDLYFYENAGKIGYKFACDTRVKVGHYDVNEDKIW